MGEIDRQDALSIVESLRFGTPPLGYVEDFTVGRESELRRLADSLDGDGSGSRSALLVRANYGSGKSHLIQVIRELALRRGWAVATVTTDAAGGVRFNRMDTIFAAVAREAQLPGTDERGFGPLFDEFAAILDDVGPDAEPFRSISDAGRWGAASTLEDPMLIGLRAWVLGGQDQRDLVEAWYTTPEQYRSRRTELYLYLVLPFRTQVADDRSDARYYINNAFWFHSDGHAHAWHGLQALDLIARAVGLKGLVLLFDEFEDVIQNLNNRDWQQKAFRNLFQFFKTSEYPSMAYFAVTPDFAAACKEELLSRGVYDFPVKRFSQLPAFEPLADRPRGLRATEPQDRSCPRPRVLLGPGAICGRRRLGQVGRAGLGTAKPRSYPHCGQDHRGGSRSRPSQWRRQAWMTGRNGRTTTCS